MPKFRIFTNDRGTRRGVALYSGFKDVTARDAEAAAALCPPQFGTAGGFAAPVAIPMPERAQSAADKDWLAKHVG